MVESNNDQTVVIGKINNNDNQSLNDSTTMIKDSVTQKNNLDVSKSKLDEEKAWKDVIGDEKPWKEYTTIGKVKTVSFNIFKTLCIFGFLYLFVCSLELLSVAFTLISGKSTGSLMNNDLITNPVVGLMVGILLTVLVQSSSTSTSIIVSMVASGLLSVHDAIPMVMGANIGTSVTNTIVAMTQVADKEQFRLAFSGATVHDMFNWMSVFVLLPIEIITGVLEALTGAIVNSINSADGAEIKFLETITDPLTTTIIQLDGQVVTCWGINELQDVDSMILQYCTWTQGFPTTPTTDIITSTEASFLSNNASSNISSELSSILPTSTLSSTMSTMITTEMGFNECMVNNSWIGEEDSCKFLFYDTGMDDQTVGVILLCMSLVLLVGSLLCVVKVLNTLLKGSIAKIIKKVINADVPYVPYLTGYIAMLIGAVLTFLVQSSSVFTSTLTPLIGLGIISVERAYPMTLGSNIGTTSTALLAAMAATGSKIDSIQIALVHLFFNIFGILLWYPIPFMRIPIPMCMFLGNTTAKYRWFAVFYLVAVFLVLPIFVFSLSLGPPALFWGIIGPVLLLMCCIAALNVFQNKWPKYLPKKLHTWEFLPVWLRTLEPYDKILTGFPCCKKCRDLQNDECSSDLEQEKKNSSRDQSINQSIRSRTSGGSGISISSLQLSENNVRKTEKGLDNNGLVLEDV